MLISAKDASTFTREAQLANFRGFDKAENQLQNFLAGELAIATPEMKQAQICRVPERPPFPSEIDQIDGLKKHSKKRLGINPKVTKPPDDNESPPKRTEDWEDLGYRLS